jgi:hypothetical protein
VKYRVLQPWHCYMTSMSDRRVWNWQALPTWSDEMWRLLSDVVDADVIVEFRQSPREFIVSDDLSWLDGVVVATSSDSYPI